MQHQQHQHQHQHQQQRQPRKEDENASNGGLSADAPEFSVVKAKGNKSGKKNKFSSENFATVELRGPEDLMDKVMELADSIKKLSVKLRTVEGRQGSLQSKIAAADKVLGCTGGAWSAELKRIQALVASMAAPEVSRPAPPEESPPATNSLAQLPTDAPELGCSGGTALQRIAAAATPAPATAEAT